MSSKFVSKTYVREEVARRAEETKTELISLFEGLHKEWSKTTILERTQDANTKLEAKGGDKSNIKLKEKGEDKSNTKLEEKEEDKTRLESKIEKLQADLGLITERVNGYTERLAILVEGGVRRTISFEGGKDDNWVKNVRLQSATDLVDYVQEVSGEGGAWRRVALEQVKDYLMEAEAVRRLVTVLEQVFEKASVTQLSGVRSSIRRVYY